MSIISFHLLCLQETVKRYAKYICAGGNIVVSGVAMAALPLLIGSVLVASVIVVVASLAGSIGSNVVIDKTLPTDSPEVSV